MADTDSGTEKGLLFGKFKKNHPVRFSGFRFEIDAVPFGHRILRAEKNGSRIENGGWRIENAILDHRSSILDRIQSYRITSVAFISVHCGIVRPI